MIVKAFDIQGKKFKKTVKLIWIEDRIAVDFGFPIQYYIEDLVEDYPYTDDFCIDIMGRNHGGFGSGPVCVSAKDMNEIVHQLIMN